MARRRLREIRLTRAESTSLVDAREAAQAAAAAGQTAPLFPQYRDDPIGFAFDVMRVRHLWRAQREILQAIAEHRRVATRSGQKIGKSTALVIAALWWACTRPRGRAVFTAPTSRQVRKVLWGELRRLMYLPGVDGRTPLDMIGVAPALLPDTGMHWPDGREIFGFTADSPAATQGLSTPELLVIVDEGSGVADDIFEALEGNCAGGGRILTTSNPVEPIGWFYEAFHSQRDAWHTLHYSSEETPNVTGLEPAIPGLAEKADIDAAREKYSEQSHYYQARVLGNFGGQGSNSVVGLALVEAAEARYKAFAAEAETLGRDVVTHARETLRESLDLGVDVARFGDDESTIAPRRGPVALTIEALQGADTIALAGKVIETARRLRRNADERVVVKIDTSGGYGGGVADLLRTQYPRELAVIDVNASEKADDSETYMNRRAQLHFAVADWLKDGGMLPPDKKLEVELLAPKYGFDVRGRRKIESKDDIKARIGRSPDRADALALAVFKAASSAAPPRIVTGSGTRWGDSQRGFW